MTSLAFFGSAMPTFFFGLLLIMLFSILPKGIGLALPAAGQLGSGAQLHHPDVGHDHSRIDLWIAACT